MATMTRRNGEGYTLIELMMVISILAILVAIVVPQFTKFSSRAHIAATATDAKNAYSAVQAWLTDNPSGNPPAEVVGPGPATGTNYPAASVGTGVTVSIAAGGTVTATHSRLNGSYVITADTGVVTDTLTPP